MIEPRDERPHEVGPEPAWSESYYFNFFDAASGLGGFSRIGIRPNEGHADGNLFLFLPDGGLAAALNRAARAGNGPARVGSVTYECREPLARWSVRCEDTALVFDEAERFGEPAGEWRRGGRAERLVLDLEFRAAMPPFGTSGRRLRTAAADATARVVAQGHFEQAGRVGGVLRLGERRWKVDALGVRDKSWGPRDWGAPRAWRWFSIPFGDDLAIGVHTVILAERQVQAGWVWRDGRTVKAAGFSLETAFEGPFHRALRLRVRDEEGYVADVEGEVRSVAALRVGPARVHEGMTRFRLGDRTTLGIAEYLDN